MKKIFTVLMLGIIALIGANQTYAYDFNNEAYTITDSVPYSIPSMDPLDYEELFYEDLAAREVGLYKSLNEENMYVYYVHQKMDNANAVLSINNETIIFYGGVYDYTNSTILNGTDPFVNGTGIDAFEIRFNESAQITLDTNSSLEDMTPYFTHDIEIFNPDLELTDLTDGQSLTQDQQDVMNSAFEPDNTVYLEIEGSTYELASRDGNVISETASSDGYSLDYTGGVVSLDYFGSSVDGATPFTIKVALSEENFSIMNVTEGDTLDFVDDYIMNEFLLSSDPIYLQIDGNDVILASRDGNVISETASSDGYSLDYTAGVITLDYYGSNVDAGTTFSLLRSLPPTISGSGVYLSDYDNPATVADVQATLTATDDPDGDLTSEITVYDDNFTGNETVLGNHDIIFQVEDAAGNVSQFTVTVSVVDITAPVITLVGDASITLGIGDTFTDPEVTVTDNVDSSPTWSYDGGAHGVDTSTPGTYTVTYLSTDSSGNEATPVTRTVIVEDTEAPYVQSNVQTITTYNSQNLTIDAVLAGITVVDDHDLTFDGSYIVTVDNYTGNESIDGSYTVTLQATDAAGNVMTHTITIVVIDDLPPVISATDYLLTPEEVAGMTQAEIKAHIESRSQ